MFDGPGCWARLAGHQYVCSKTVNVKMDNSCQAIFISFDNVDTTVVI